MVPNAFIAIFVAKSILFIQDSRCLSVKLFAYTENSGIHFRRVGFVIGVLSLRLQIVFLVEQKLSIYEHSHFCRESLHD